MKRIEFVKLQATDFKVFRDFTFEFAAFGPGCHGIRGRNNVQPRLGSNGVGKSSLWDALCFVLYGRTAKRLRSTDVQPYGSRNNPKVTLWLNVDGKPHLIERCAVPHTLTLTGNPCNQERIDSLLGISFDLFLHTVLLAQGCPLFLDLEPRFKLSLLTDVLRLHRFEDYSKRASTALGKLDADKQRLIMRSESVCGGIAEVGRELARVRSQSEAFRETKANELAELRQHLANTELLMQEATAEAGKAHTAFKASHAHVDEAYKGLMQARAKAELAMVLKRNTIKLKIGDPCPTCHQPVDMHAVDALERHAARVLTDSGHHVATKRYAHLKARHDRLIGELEQALAVEHTTEQAHNAAQAALDAAAASDNPFEAIRHQLKQRLHDLHQEEKAFAKQIATVEAAAATVTPWVSGFRDIRLIVLDDVLSSLSVLTTSYANELGLACNVRFGIDRQTKAGGIVSGVHLSVDAVEKFEAWSGGEAQRLRLAASLALSASLLTEAGVSINILALDEPSAHLSPEGLDELTAFLTQHAEAEGRTVFLTDQSPLKLADSILLTRNPDNVTLEVQHG